MSINQKFNSNGELGISLEKPWSAADKLRSNMDASEYTNVILGPIFLRYISHTFGEVYLSYTDYFMMTTVDPFGYERTIFGRISVLAFPRKAINSLLRKLMSGNGVPMEA